MEWPADFECSPLDESFFGFLQSPQIEMEPKSSEWTFEENKLFESALAEIDPTSPAFLENVASRIPWKSMEDVKNHYQALLDDIEMIESGKIPLPDYPDLDVDQAAVPMMMQQDQGKKDEGSPSNPDPKIRSNAHQRRRGVPWTEEEHQLFLMGLNKYGKGDWRSISRYYVISKTPTQVASHAQKYFRRQTSSTPADRRRPSIHDIQTVTPTPTPIPTRPSTLSNAVDSPLPNFHLMINGPPAPNPMFINNHLPPPPPPLMNNPPPLPPLMNNPPPPLMNNPSSIMNMNMNMNNLNFASVDPMFNQNNIVLGEAAYPSVEFLMMNQQWS